MSCRKATELLSASLDRPLTRMEKVRLRVHLVICSACRRYRRQVDAIDRALQLAVGGDAVANLDDTLALSDEARARMERALEDGIR
jgi:predicted anti-sigma-YlaC factor YlaD